MTTPERTLIQVMALFHKLSSGDPESFASQFFVLLGHVMKHSSNGSKPPQLEELAAHPADLKKSEALKASQAPEIRKYLEQLNASQGDILKLKAFARCPLRPSAMTLGANAWPGR